MESVRDRSAFTPYRTQGEARSVRRFSEDDHLAEVGPDKLRPVKQCRLSKRSRLCFHMPRVYRRSWGAFVTPSLVQSVQAATMSAA